MASVWELERTIYSTKQIGFHSKEKKKESSMGNAPAAPQVQHGSGSRRDDETVLYSIELHVGDIEYTECKPGEDFPTTYTLHPSSNALLGKGSEAGGLAVELLLHCKNGDIGPLPFSQLRARERRKMELWSKDVGPPRFCIVIMYREHYREFPRWSIKDCLVQCTRANKSFTQTKFKHIYPIYGGTGVVYSVTMAPYFTSEDREREKVEVVVERAASETHDGVAEALLPKKVSRREKGE